MAKKNNQNPTICFCHRVRKKTIEEAIDKGAKSLDEIFDITTAGVGPCGGSCRPNLRKILHQQKKK